jgi:hypothetical protein
VFVRFFVRRFTEINLAICESGPKSNANRTVSKQLFTIPNGQGQGQEYVLSIPEHRVFYYSQHHPTRSNSYGSP